MNEGLNLGEIIITRSDYDKLIKERDELKRKLEMYRGLLLISVKLAEDLKNETPDNTDEMEEIDSFLKQLEATKEMK